MSNLIIVLIVVISIVVVSLLGIIVFLVIRYIKSDEKPRHENINTTFERETYYKSGAERYGEAGEIYVARYLKEYVDTHNGYLFNDFCFQDEDGYSSQIDHIVITQGGVFVIETKTCKGIIIGTKDDGEWVSSKDGLTYKELENPIKQNNGHISHLRRMLGSGAPKMQSIIIFPVGDISRINSDSVMDLNGALNLIDVRTNQSKYSKDFVNNINSRLKTILEKYGISKSKHVENIKNKYRS